MYEITLIQKYDLTICHKIVTNFIFCLFFKVEIPRLLNLPPSLKTAEDRIDTEPIHETMNCEVLADSLDLQLRYIIPRRCDI